MEAFQTYRGVVGLLDRANVDTDQIIPKQFLKSIARTGFGEHLFCDWRLRPDGSEDPDFELNQPRYRKATILAARNNFGCGSSREHAVWAVVQAGFKAIIAPRRERDGNRVPAFADIFANNAVKNGLLTVELAEAEVDEIFALASRFEGLEITVNLEEQRVVLHTDLEEVAFHFDVDPVVKQHLIKGMDDIDLTLEYVDRIDAFEAAHDLQLRG